MYIQQRCGKKVFKVYTIWHLWTARSCLHDTEICLIFFLETKLDIWPEAIQQYFYWNKPIVQKDVGKEWNSCHFSLRTDWKFRVKLFLQSLKLSAAFHYRGVLLFLAHHFNFLCRLFRFIWGSISARKNHQNKECIVFIGSFHVILC